MADNNGRTLTANFVADTSGFSPKVNELIQKLKTLNQDFQTNKTKVSELNTQLKAYEKELRQLNTATNNGANATTQQQQRMQQLRDSIAACNTQIGTYRAAQTNLRSQINSTNRELTEQQQAFNGVSTAAMSFGDILKANLASGLIQQALHKILNLMRQASAYCYQVGSSFEAAMSQVAAVSGASADELERLTEKAKELGSTTKFTATETAQAMNYMAMAGWKTEEMLEGIDGILGLAAASGTDLATTSDIVTDALTAFGIAADGTTNGISNVSHFADILAAASANANTNVSMMGETFKYCAPVAGALGFSAEDVAVSVGLMANSGIKATNAGTAMRTIMTKLAKDVKVTGDAIGEVTVKTTNADGSMRSYAEILGELRGVFEQLMPAEKSVAAEAIVGKNAMTGFLALMNAGEADVQKLTNAIADCDGAAADMAETMQDNLKGAVTTFNSALEGVGIAVYDKFKDNLTDAVNLFTDALGDMKDEVEDGELGESLEDLAGSFKNAASELAVIMKEDLPDFIKGLSNVITFVVNFRKEIASTVSGIIAFKAAMKIGNLITGLVSSFKALRTAMTATTAATSAATTAQTGLNAAMAANPVGAVAAVVGLLAGGIAELVMHTNDATDSIKSLSEASDKAAESSQDYIDKSKDLKDVKKRYDEVYNSEKPAAEKTAELRDLQNELIEQFPDLAGKIGLVSDAYDDVAESIQKAIDEQDKYAGQYADQALAIAKDEQKQYEYDPNALYNYFRGLGGDDRTALWNKIKSLQSFRDTGQGTFKLGGGENSSYEQLESDLTELLEYMQDELGLTANTPVFGEILDAAKAAGEKAADLASKQLTYDQTRGVRGPRSGTNMTTMGGMFNDDDPYGEYADEPKKSIKDLFSQEEREEMYKEEKQLADDMYSVEEIGAEEYYKKLTELRDDYLDENTHEWYQASAEILKASKKAGDGLADAAKNTAKTVKNSLSEVEMAYKKTLAAIDAEIERRNREKSDAAFQTQIDEIDERLNYGRLDDFSKYELEKERQRLIDEHNDELYDRQAADAKSIVQDVYSAKTTLDKALPDTKEYTLALGDYTDALADLTDVMRGVGSALGVRQDGNSSVSNIDESIINQYNNIVLQAVNRSNSQLIDELIKALHSGL